jgi:hypothetical protein
LGRGQHGGVVELQFPQADLPAEGRGGVEERVDPAGLKHGLGESGQEETQVPRVDAPGGIKRGRADGRAETLPGELGLKPAQ